MGQPEGLFSILTHKRDFKKRVFLSFLHFFASSQGETFPGSVSTELTQLPTGGWVWSCRPRELEDILIGCTGSAERTAAVQSARSALWMRRSRLTFSPKLVFNSGSQESTWWWGPNRLLNKCRVWKDSGRKVGTTHDDFYRVWRWQNS